MTGAQIAAAARRQQSVIPRPSVRQRWSGLLFRGLLGFAIFISVAFLITLLVDVASDGLPKISWDFLTSFPSRVSPERAGIESAIVGTLFLMAITAAFVVPIGVATAVYLEEYADRTRWYNRLVESTSRTSPPCRRSSTGSSGWPSSCAGRSTWATSCSPAG